MCSFGMEEWEIFLVHGALHDTDCLLEGSQEDLSAGHDLEGCTRCRRIPTGWDGVVWVLHLVVSQ